MKIRAVVGEAFGSIMAARRRSILALFGISVGIGSVIAMITMGEIVTGESLAQFRELGTDLVAMTKIDARRGRRGAEIAVEDVVDLPFHTSTIVTAAAWADSINDVRYAGSKLGSKPVLGVTEGFARIGKLRLESGRFISDLDYRRHYCVVGSDVARAMGEAGAARVPGEQIRVFGRLFTVVGVLRSVGARDFLNQSEPNAVVYLPLTTMMRAADTGSVRHLVLRMRPDVLPEEAVHEATSFLRSRAGGILEFRVTSAKQLIEQMRQQSRLFALLLGAIGGISLIVGGVGVMNLMLISVSERRGEIGLRRAIGARRRDIRRQFVSESVVLCLTGGMLGIGLGSGVSYAICLFTGLPYALSTTSVVLGVATSTAIGVFFGFYPAHRASRLDPIAALRA